MPDRYWVGGTANWDGTAGTKWSTTSGGAGGASVPTSADDVFFTNLSTGTCTIEFGNTGAKSLNCTGFTGTLAGSATPLTVSGNVTLSTGMTTSSPFFTIDATSTFISNGKSIGILTINIASGTLTLGGALTSSNLVLTSGGLNLAGFNLTCPLLSSSNTNTRSIDFGSGNIALTGSGNVLQMSTATNFSSTGTGGITRNNTATCNFTFGPTGATVSNVMNLTVNAGAFTVQFGVNSWFKNLSFAGSTSSVPAMTVTNINGNITLGGATSYAGLSATVRVSATIDCAGRSFGNLTINGAGITVSPVSNYIGAARSITIADGTFTTTPSNYSVDCGGIQLNSATCTLTLNGSTVNAVGLFNSGGTINAGTSQLNITGAGGNFAGGGQTFNNVAFTNTTYTSAFAISGANTFNNLSFAARTVNGAVPISFSADQVINGTLTLSASANAANRLFLTSSAIGTPRTLTCAAIATLSDVDFRSITIAGPVAPVSGTRLGNCGGNSGITFAAGVLKYWNLAGGTAWANTAWALSPGGTPAADNYPLPQDTCVFQNAGLNTGSTVSASGQNIGTLDMSARTNAMTLSNTSNASVYGNWITGTGVTISSGTSPYAFSGQSNQTITSNGITFGNAITYNGSASLILQDALTISSPAAQAFLLTDGVLNLNGRTLTLSNTGTAGFNIFTGSGSSRNITFNGGSIVIASSAPLSFNNNAPAGFTTTAGTGVGSISMTGSTAKTFVGAGSTYNCTINQGGAGALTISGSNTFNNITNTYASTGATSVLFTAGATNVFTSFNLTGQATRVCTLGSTSTSQTTLQKSSAWLMGANSTNGGNNTGLSFTAGGGIDYLSVSYINGVVGTLYTVGGRFLPFFF